jgi:hypothetical protein
MRAVIEQRAAGGRSRCALLDEDNRCTVYAIRPMKCRACNSLDVDPCRRWEEEGSEDTACQVYMLPRLYAQLTVMGVLKALMPDKHPGAVPHTELMQTLLTLLEA